jgi:hypothetical protein
MIEQGEIEKRRRHPNSACKLSTTCATSRVAKHGTVEKFQSLDVHDLHRAGALQEALVSFAWASLRWPGLVGLTANKWRVDVEFRGGMASPGEDDEAGFVSFGMCKDSALLAKLLLPCCDGSSSRQLVSRG